MIAVDAFVLERSLDDDGPWGAVTRDLLRELGRGKAPWAMPWSAVADFMCIAVSGERSQPLLVERAAQIVDGWLASPSLRLLSIGPRTFAIHRELVRSRRGSDPQPLEDLGLSVALCVEHGIGRLISFGLEEPRVEIGGVLVTRPSLS
ncbi:MAG: hypothetical protein U1E65_01115 [Myxococcota bacterium]